MLPAGIAIRSRMIVSAGCVKLTSVFVSSVTAIVPVVTEVHDVITLSDSSRTSVVRAEFRPVSLILITGFAIFFLQKN